MMMRISIQVLLMNTDNTAAVHIIPKSIARGEAKFCMMANAIRLWRFHFSIAKDIKKPAKNKKITRYQSMIQ